MRKTGFAVSIVFGLGLALARPSAQSGIGRFPWPGPEGGTVRTDTRTNPQLPAGSSVPELEGVDLQGNPVSVKYGAWAVPTVLYTPCGVTDEERDFSTLVTHGRNKYHFVITWPVLPAVQEDRLARYLAAQRPTWEGVPVDVVKVVSRDAVQALWLVGCTRTYVVSPAGKMLHNWLGVWDGALRKDVEQVFGLELPHRPGIR